MSMWIVPLLSSGPKSIVRSRSGAKLLKVAVLLYSGGSVASKKYRAERNFLEKGGCPPLAPVAQTDRAVDFESTGWGFNSLQARM